MFVLNQRRAKVQPKLHIQTPVRKGTDNTHLRCVARNVTNEERAFNAFTFRVAELMSALTGSRQKNFAAFM